jgi:hypothetical protein
MKEKSKAILGQRISNRLYLSDHDKMKIINDYLKGSETKQSVYKRYTGYSHEHGKISKWMRSYGIEDDFVKKPNFVYMPKQKINKVTGSNEFETHQLKKRIAELEKQLQIAKMKSIAFSTMVDIAEKDFNIPIRKKHNTKPSK